MYTPSKHSGMRPCLFCRLFIRRTSDLWTNGHCHSNSLMVTEGPGVSNPTAHAMTDTGLFFLPLKCQEPFQQGIFLLKLLTRVLHPHGHHIDRTFLKGKIHFLIMFILSHCGQFRSLACGGTPLWELGSWNLTWYRLVVSLSSGVCPRTQLNLTLKRKCFEFLQLQNSSNSTDRTSSSSACSTGTNRLTF